MVKKMKKDSIMIPRKAVMGIAPAVAITGVLIAKGNPAVFLF